MLRFHRLYNSRVNLLSILLSMYFLFKSASRSARTIRGDVSRDEEFPDIHARCISAFGAKSIRERSARVCETREIAHDEWVTVAKRRPK